MWRSGRILGLVGALGVIFSNCQAFIPIGHGLNSPSRAQYRSSLVQCPAKGFGAKPIGEKKGGEDESIMWRGTVRALFPDRLPKEDEVSSTPCPCGSGKSYDACCLPLHEGTSLPQNAEALLRSRYTAYFYGFPDYLVKTTHPKSAILSTMNAKKYLASVSESCKVYDLRGLQIVDREGDIEGNGPEGSTAFLTFVVKRKTLQSERSKFVRAGGRWMWIDEDRA